MLHANNVATVAGNLVADPVIGSFERNINGRRESVKTATARLAMDRTYRSSDMMQEDVSYIQLRFYGHNAEFVEKYLKKGNAISAIGTFRHSTRKKEDGTYTHCWMLEVESLFSSKHFQMSNNNLQLIGRLVKNPEVFEKEETKMARFTVAVSLGKRISDHSEISEFHQVCAFGKIAEFVENYLKKGMMVFVDGRMQSASYDKDGETVFFTNVIANRISFAEKLTEEPSEITEHTENAQKEEVMEGEKEEERKVSKEESSDDASDDDFLPFN